MKPYGIKIGDRRPMYDYSSDKYNSRGCFNRCKCNICKKKKYKIRQNNARARKTTNVKNRMRSAKKSQRQYNKRLCKDNTEGQIN